MKNTCRKKEEMDKMRLNKQDMINSFKKYKNKEKVEK
jgi:hypothetical protein